MLSKTTVRARLPGSVVNSSKKGSTELLAAALLLVLGAACGSAMPWKDDPPVEEINLAFVLRNNLLYVPSARIDGLPGDYFFGSATSRTVLDPKHAARRRAATNTVTLGERGSARVSVVSLPLGGLGDGIIGADAVGSHSVTIDYRSGLITIDKGGMHPEYMTLFSFTGEPVASITVDGREVAAVVDTAHPDTLVLPSAQHLRGKASVSIAGTNFGTIDVAYAPVARARIGNRLLSRFLISIDYRRGVLGLWRDPRIP